MTNQVSQDVSAYRIEGDGALSPVPGSPFEAGKESVSAITDPTGKFLFVTSKFSHNVLAYRVAEDGSLEPVPGSPFAAGAGPNSAACIPLSNRERK